MNLTRTMSVLLLALGLSAGISAFAQTQTTQPHVTNISVSHTSSQFKANYLFDGNFDETVKLHRWVGEFGTDFSTWDRNNVFATITPNTPTPLYFSVPFPYADFNMVAGKTYAYTLSDRIMVDGAVFFATPGTNPLRCFKIDVGAVDCPIPGTPAADPDPDPDPAVPAPTPTTPTTTGGTTSTGQVTVAFPPSEQVIGLTNAVLKGTLSVPIEMPVNLAVVAGASGSPLGNQQSAYSSGSATVKPNETKTFTVTYNGLSPSTTYEFALKNLLTNTTSSPLEFTTGGTDGTSATGISHTGGLFPYTQSNYNNQSTGDATLGLYPDMVSDTGIVPKCGRTAGPNVPEEETKMCTYKDFMQLVANVIQYGLVLLGIATAITVMYAGAMLVFLSWNGDPTAEVKAQVKKYRSMLFRIAIGVFIILIAWTIVATILRTLEVDPSYILLDLVS